MNQSSSNIPTASDIEVINALYRKCLDCTAALQDAYVEWDRRRDESVAITTLQQNCEKASRAFEDFKKRMGGEVKFDIEKGEYFPKNDASGNENFRIKVTRTQTVTVNIDSTSREAALRTVKDAVANARVTEFGPTKYTYEDISR